ncbi:MAG: dUTP diphosphatase [Rhodobacteraceae bacterium]|nr:dUTP diphosphatase [Paracoccaceae bacterium]
MGMRVDLWREDWADPKVSLPDYATEGAAGAELPANFPAAQRQAGLLLAPMARELVPTGLRVAIPEGYEMQIRPRSGIALKRGVTVLNSPGTIDSDYRGALGVLLINLGAEPYQIRHGDRIAQAIIAPVVQACFALVDSLSVTERKEGGFGSTGII